MKLKVVLELETLEQVGVILSAVNDWNVNVDVAPIFDTPNRKSKAKKKTKKKRKSKGKQNRTSVSSPDTLLRSTGARPTTLPDLYDKVIPTIEDWPLTRTDLAKRLAEVRGHTDTKATSTIVTKWIKQRALKPVKK